MKEYILEEDKLLEIKSDRLFHDMFNAHEMDTIEWTVMMILGKSYEEIHGNVKVSNTRLTNMSKDDKQKFVDLIVNIDNKKIIIELNNNYNGNYVRNTLYALNAINNSYIEGDYYTKKVQGILVNLNWIKEKGKYSKKEITYAYPIEGEEEREYLLKIININLAYYEKRCYTEFEGVDRLSKLLTIDNKKELKAISEKEKLLDNSYSKMDRLSHDKEYCGMIWDERIENNLRKAEAYYGGVKDGKKQGKKEGIKATQKVMIHNMYNKNIPIETISECANLSILEVQKIINS